jgi:AcrR family transcriptional regulator
MTLDETRRRLLDNARAHYLEVGGGEHFSLREVARRSGVSAAAVYRHFESKDLLFAEIVSEGFRVFQLFLMRALAEGTPLERLRAAGRYYLAFAMEHSQHYSVIFMTRETTIPKGSPSGVYPENAATFQFLVDRVRECMEVKVLRSDDPVALAASIWAHVHGLASLRLTGHLLAVGDEEAFAKFYATSVDDHLRGLAP